MLRRYALAVAFLLPSLAHAQSTQGLYVAGAVGPNFDGTLRAAQGVTKVAADPGPAGSIALGWRFGNGIRAEIEGSDGSSTVSGISTRRVNGLLYPLTSPTGDVANYSVMTNVLYDLPVHVHPFGLTLHPYVGAGLGYSWLDFNQTHGGGVTIFELPQHNQFTGPSAVDFGAAGALAYQAIVGASLPIRTVHGLELTAEYRFVGTARADIPVTRTATGGDTVNGAIPSYATRNGFEAQGSRLMIGARYSFGAS